MKSRKIIAAFLLLCILLVSMPAVYADLDRIVLQTFPGSNTGNDLPYVGQEISAFRVTAKTNNVTVSNWTLVDDYGSPCYDYVIMKRHLLSLQQTGVQLRLAAVFTRCRLGRISGTALQMKHMMRGIFFLFSLLLLRIILPLHGCL